MTFCAGEVSPARKSPWCHINTPLAGWFFCAFFVTYSERLTSLQGLRKTRLKIDKIPQLQKAMWNLTRTTIWCEALIFYSTFLQDCSHAGVAGLLIYLLKEQVNQALCVSNTLKLWGSVFCLFVWGDFWKEFSDLFSVFRRGALVPRNSFYVDISAGSQTFLKNWDRKGPGTRNW